MDFRYRGLPVEGFAPLFSLTDRELERRAVRRMLVDEKPGFPCRITLEDAEAGETVLLLAYEHQPANSPFRAAGPIFVRENARDSFDRIGAPPAMLLSRLLSVRAYAQDGMMVDADVAEGRDLQVLLERLCVREDVAYAHIHFARRGCFACRVEPA